MLKPIQPNEIRISRTYNAPVEKVWEAWTDMSKVQQWWGPRGFSITNHSKTLKQGGHWHFTMHGPDGHDYPNIVHYLEVKHHTHLEYNHGAEKDQPAHFRVSVDFSNVHGKTKMDMSMFFPTPEAASQTKLFIKKAGGESTWDRLAEFLEKEQSGKEIFVITRTLEIDSSQMYELWTDPKHFKHWMGPIGSTMEIHRCDIRPGGSAFYSMSGVGDNLLYGKVHYLKMQKYDILVYTQQFADKNEKISPHPMVPTWPETMLTTINFVDEAKNATRITLTWEIYGKVSPEEIATFTAARNGMADGWTGSFDRLENYALNLRT